jgi:hypothetical protein
MKRLLSVLLLLPSVAFAQGGTSFPFLSAANFGVVANDDPSVAPGRRFGLHVHAPRAAVYLNAVSSGTPPQWVITSNADMHGL